MPKRLNCCCFTNFIAFQHTQYVRFVRTVKSHFNDMKRELPSAENGRCRERLKCLTGVSRYRAAMYGDMFHSGARYQAGK
ncbi:hypothetical protein KIN20_011078 [Parelaphostrongylus tenuis]|uniref:Uncharacterized protein n=1 Tax=Parelaphostrongylus tenuis TaxID=148309 RepID=A0AAD5MRJ6_PARTN|nr:hypothetical protein KIN20_011078 [Parelaphostrongylus tenuis]